MFLELKYKETLFKKEGMLFNPKELAVITKTSLIFLKPTTGVCSARKESFLNTIYNK